MDETQEWPERAWLLTGLGAAAGAVFGLLISGATGAYLDPLATAPPLPLWRLALATLVFSAFVALALSLERRRWTWAVAAAVTLGTLLGAIGWNTAQYRGYGWAFDWPFASALIASLILLPLFQTVRDEGAMRLPPERVHGHVWADFVIGAVSVLFVGIVFLLVALIDQLLRLVGITVIEALWETRWFGFALAGAAFGGVAARLRDREGLLGTLLTVFFVVLAVLAPVLAVGIALFLGALPFGGLQSFWAATGSSTVILLACAVLSVWLVNAVIGGERGAGMGRRVLRLAALVLVLAVLPLGVIGAVGLGIRIDALGWTPTRLWGVAAIAVTIAWGAAYLWTVVRRRGLDEGAIFAANVRLGLVVAAIALFLALPLVDFGAVSTRSQLARLSSGQVTPERFDWSALAFDFGEPGRRAVRALARSPDPVIASAALAAATAKNRYDLAGPEVNERESAARRAVAERVIRLHPAGGTVPLPLRRAIFGVSDSDLLTGLEDSGCDPRSVVPCDLFWRPGDDIAVALQDGCAALPAVERVAPAERCKIMVTPFRRVGSRWSEVKSSSDEIRLGTVDERASLVAERAAIDRGDVTVRTVTRRQVFVGEKPVSGLFE